VVVEPTPDRVTVAPAMAAEVEALVTLPLRLPLLAVTVMVQVISGPNQVTPSRTSLNFSVYVPGVDGAVRIKVNRPTLPLVTSHWSTSVGRLQPGLLPSAHAQLLGVQKGLERSCGLEVPKRTSQ